MRTEDIIKGLEVSCVFGGIGMNERIKELSEQAENYADANFKGQPTWSEAFESKFAELIVRECVTVLERLQDDTDKQNWPTPYDCAEAIKEHFGVTE